MTIGEYFQTPETVAPQELIYGAMRVADSPTPRHQRAVGQLFLALTEHLRPRWLGEVWLAPLDVVLDAERALVVQPDLFVVMVGGSARVGDRVFGAPDLVIEVLSPKPRIGEVDERLIWLAENGVRECWLVHQAPLVADVVIFADGRVAGRRRFAADDSLVSTVLPDFRQTLTSMLGH
jgi:Uma2 family endonuclease